MQPGLSTYVFLPQRLYPGLLDSILRACDPFGTPVIEVFAARHHFDYTDRSIVRDLATWFRDTGTHATLHQPLYMDAHWSRHVSPNLNLVDPEKSRRIDAMDEVKRVLESAEQIPFTSITLHLGLKHDAWNLRALENSLTAIEHLNAFARPLGVKVLLENIENEITTPAHLLEILRAGHFENVGVALDLGHLHLSSSPAENSADAIELLRPRLTTLYLHDNHGMKDEHLWPVTEKAAGEATAPVSIDWENAARQIATLPASLPAILEITYELNETPESVARKASAFFSEYARLSEALLQSNPA
ncbi:MAG: hypothetical protein NVSMB3_02900 [Acidobacteriaceae bacterium]